MNLQQLLAFLSRIGGVGTTGGDRTTLSPAVTDQLGASPLLPGRARVGVTNPPVIPSRARLGTPPKPLTASTPALANTNVLGQIAGLNSGPGVAYNPAPAAVSYAPAPIARNLGAPTATTDLANNVPSGHELSIFASGPGKNWHE